MDHQQALFRALRAPPRPAPPPRRRGPAGVDRAPLVARCDRFGFAFDRQAFDRLDNLLNANFGLPPVGLPPKQLFGLDDPEVIRSRHAVLAAYLKDCIARPVLILSQELQDFIEMPREVRERVRKGGI